MENIGIQVSSLLIQIVNFVLMIFVLNKLLYKPILKILRERKKKIELGLEHEEKMRKNLEEAQTQREEILEKSRAEAQKIIEEAKATAKKQEAEIIEKAHKETQAILTKGRKELEDERIELEKRLKKHTVDLATSMVEKLLGDVLREVDHQQIIDKKLKDIAKLTK